MQEVVDKLTTLQGVYESGQRDIYSKLDRVFNYISKETHEKESVIKRMKQVNAEHEKLLKDYHFLQDRAHCYKLLLISTLIPTFLGILLFILVKTHALPS